MFRKTNVLIIQIVINTLILISGLTAYPQLIEPDSTATVVLSSFVIVGVILGSLVLCVFVIVLIILIIRKRSAKIKQSKKVCEGISDFLDF